MKPLSPALDDRQIERFEQLAWPLLADVLRVATILCRDPVAAEDLTQETMLKALRFMDRFESGTDVRAWLLTILRRTFLDSVRAGKRRAGELSLDHPDAPEPAADTDESGLWDAQWDQPQALMDRLEDQAVIDAMQSLPDEIRWTLLLVDVQQIDQAAASAILEVPVGTIKSRLHRGRGMLRDLLFEDVRRRGWIS